MKVVGYTDRFSVRAGEPITFMISSEEPRFEAKLVRLIHGDPNPMGPGFKYEPVACALDGVHDGKRQLVRNGSYVEIPSHPAAAALRSFSAGAWVMPTLADRPQTILAGAGPDGGWALEMDEAGRLGLRLGTAESLVMSVPLKLKTWHHIAFTFDAESGEACLLQHSRDDWPGHESSASDGGRLRAPAPFDGRLRIAAGFDAAYPQETVRHFNGRIDRPWVHDRALSRATVRAIADHGAPVAPPGLTAAWDFARSMGDARIIDTSTNAIDGVAVNMPTRGVRGHNWSGITHDFKAAPHEYGAVHFHDDDLDDCRWEPTFTFIPPASLKSGIYALRLRAGDGEDHIPFFVRPAVGAKPSKVALLLPTFSYLAYGNEAIANRPDMRELLKAAAIEGELDYPATPEDRYIVENRLLSVYDLHSDGSGVNYSSRLRPILSMRPSYYNPLTGFPERPQGAPHQFGGDLYIADWLEAAGHDFDVLTDDDLADEGIATLSPYKVVITGTHPEYATATMVDAVSGYLRSGGRIMYLGGNGFYWVTSLAEPRRHAIETRRARGLRPWTNDPAEEQHSTTGEQGGLWKHRNRAPQRYLGVGMSAVGFDSGVPYVRTEAASDPRAAFIFEGLEPDAVIGAGPNLFWGQGAAGFEVDRADETLGTPPTALVVATARLTSDSFQIDIDELESPGPHAAGPNNPNARADMVLVPYPGGGAAFSVGSILWAGALSQNGYDNTVSKVTGNVLAGFLRD